MRDLPSILFLFQNEFNTFNNNTGARLLDEDYFEIPFLEYDVIILSLWRQFCCGRHNRSPKISKPPVVYRFYCMAVFYSHTKISIFFFIDMSIMKKSCSSAECSGTCPVVGCLSVGVLVTVGVRCWNTEAPLNTTDTTVNITTVSNSSFTSMCPVCRSKWIRSAS